MTKEDLKEFGFIFVAKTICEWYELEGRFEDGFASYGYWSKIKLIKCNDKIKLIAYEYSWEEEDSVLFQGSCSNKFEFKKLLHQLNLLDE